MNVSYGGLAAFNALAFGQQNHQNAEFFRNSIAAMPEMTGAYAQQFNVGMRQIFEVYHGAEAVAIGRAALNQAVGLSVQNTFRRLSTFENLQQAGPMMQRVIMANPVVRRLYQDQRLDGYSDTYVDTEKGRIGEDHYEFRRLTDGVVEFGEGDAMTVRFFDEVDPFDQPRPTASEKADAMSTWEWSNYFLAEAAKDTSKPQDFTDIWSRPAAK